MLVLYVTAEVGFTVSLLLESKGSFTYITLKNHFPLNPYTLITEVHFVHYL